MKEYLIYPFKLAGSDDNNVPIKNERVDEILADYYTATSPETSYFQDFVATLEKTFYD